ncbi:MAG: 3-isopropylmalate dehydratase [Deltaproteobacteria bacterium]|nr:3-isopropylmalate dehydratase [Deltaproteobacteria bacterium]
MGIAHKFGDDINTDYIIASKRKRDTVNPQKLARFLMEDICPGLGEMVQPGDFLVAGENFGCGSAMEIAALVVLGAGIKAVLAKSFARTFFRNALNLGLLLLTCDTDRINPGDHLEVAFEGGMIRNLSQKTQIPFQRLPDLLKKIIRSGGIVPFLESPEGKAVLSSKADSLSIPGAGG